MGMAMLDGWLKGGLKAENTYVFDPNPSPSLKNTNVHLNAKCSDFDVIVLAVKPQIMGEVLKTISPPDHALMISVAAGCPIALFENAFGDQQKIIRTMPNTPAAVGAGITAICGNPNCDAHDLELATRLLGAVGEVVVLDSEADMDAVTAVSGSGPAYVFHLIEAMTEAGIAEGLSPDVARQLAKATVAGAGRLVMETGEDPGVLRENVTSPNGTTFAALNVLMDTQSGLSQLMKKTINAAANRSRELGKS